MSKMTAMVTRPKLRPERDQNVKRLRTKCNSKVRRISKKNR